MAGYDLVKIAPGGLGATRSADPGGLRLLPLPQAQATVETHLLSAAAVDGRRPHRAAPCEPPWAVGSAARTATGTCWLVGGRRGGPHASRSRSGRGPERRRSCTGMMSTPGCGAPTSPVAGPWPARRAVCRFKVGLHLPAAQRVENLLNAQVRPRWVERLWARGKRGIQRLPGG